MMQIPCIYCGLRDENEFVCGGTSHLQRPGLDDGDDRWGHYLFFRENPRGLHLERWRHVQGCGVWFNLARDTLTHEVRAVYGITESPPL
jgi:heterotetrameric sarcosine oxidase delta subunit